MVDPLEGLEHRPIDVQVAVLANEVRNQRNTLGDVERELSRTKQALWALVASIVAGIVIFLVTQHHQPPPLKSSAQVVVSR